ncbi:MAG TPA: hypothetical protein VFN01_01465 [Marinobacter sp.]|uniref:hypothetical protein n=1 Tax=Marinobacter sp. TaxID=50741 RepID=UPI002D7ED309|nr:hypothetical protein [Marinobacter sp.]HET8799826.1 hypothetical protein [Marinobacter sp.]
MRHSCLFAAFSLPFLGLVGCGLEDTGPTAFNPATNVDVTFSSFTLTEQTGNTLFADLFRAVEPASTEGSDAEARASGIRSQLATFLGLTVSGDPTPALDSVRNPLDLMRRVIGENNIANFNDARQYISARIDVAQAGEYSNTTNDVYIRFTDPGAFVDGRPVSEYEWRYPIVKWVYTPDTSNQVTRILNWVASGTFAESSTRPSATLGTQFLPRDFQVSGYNDGARLHTEGSIVIAGEREMSFVREYEGANTDTLNIDGTAVGTQQGSTGGPEFEFAGDTVDCLKIRLDYEAGTVDLFTSLDQPPQEDDPDNPGQTRNNEQYCLNLDSPTASYQTATSGGRN